MNVTTSAYTHAGKVRAFNEDTVAVGTWTSPVAMNSPYHFVGHTSERTLAFVADGLGGHDNGRMASLLASKHLAGLLMECGPRARDVENAICEVNRILYYESEQRVEFRGMGTTIAGHLALGSQMWLFNVGDSRVFRLRDGFLSQVSIDDVRSPSFFGQHDLAERSGAITQALGGHASYHEVLPHVREFEVVPDLTIMSCTDGLHGVVSVDAMETAINSDIAGSVSRLLDLAIDSGGPDNISVVLTRFSDGPR